MKTLRLALALLVLSGWAAAQSSGSSSGSVTVSGAVTSGHCTSFLSSTQIQDAGAACGAGGAPAFSSVTAGTNTAALVEGTGGSITPTGTGIISANQLNGTALSGLATGILKNTTATGVPSIAIGSDLPTAIPIGSVGSAGLSGTAPIAISAAGAISITSPLPVANGGTGTASTLTGLVRGSASAMTAAELSGDCTTSGSNAVTCTKINNTTVPTSANLLGTNGSAQPIAASAHNVAVPLMCAIASGSGTAYTCTTAPSFAPADGDVVIAQIDTTNTGAATLNVNASSAAPIKKQFNVALVANDILAGQDLLMEFDGVNWQVLQMTNAVINASTSLTTGTAPANTLGSSGGMVATEGTAFTGLSASYGWYNDSTLHCFDIIDQTTNIGCGVGEASIIGANVIPKATGTTSGVAASSVSDNGTTVATTETITVGTAGGAAGFVDKTAALTTSAMGAQTTATCTNITNMTWTIAANKNYILECHVPMTLAATATIQYCLAGPGTATSYSLEADGDLGTAGIWSQISTLAQTAYGGKTGASAAVAANTVQHVWATIQNGATASGTALTLQTAANGTNAITVGANASCQLTQTN